MSFDGHANFVYQTLGSSLSSGATSATLTADFTNVPSWPANATIWPAGTTPSAANAEIVRVTADSSGTLTITRAQEGTSAKSFSSGAQVAVTITSKTITDIESGGSLTASALASGAVTAPKLATILQPAARAGIAVNARGLLSENGNPMNYIGQGILSSGNYYFMGGLGVINGDTVTGAALGVITAGSGTAPGYFYVGLYTFSSGTLTRVAVSNNLNSSGSLTSSGIQKFAFSSPYSVTTDQAVYLGVIQNGTFGTTNVTFAQFQGSANMAGSLLGGDTSKMMLFNQQNPGANSLPSSVSISSGSSNNPIWCGLY